MQFELSPSSTGVKVFKGSINEIEDMINIWLASASVRVINSSMTYDDKGGLGSVFVLVSFETGK